MVKQLYSARGIGRSFDQFSCLTERLLFQHHSYIYRHPINSSILHLISEISYTFVGSIHIKIILNSCVNLFICVYIVARIYHRRGARRWRKVRRINGHAFVAKRLQVCILVVYACICILLNRSRYVY